MSAGKVEWKVQAGLHGRRWIGEARSLAATLWTPRVELLVGLAVTFGLVGIIAAKLWELGLAVFAPLARVGPLFWLVFLADYLLTPTTERLIFGWRWPARRGLMRTLLQKQAADALLVSYAGEVMLFAWARRAGVETGRAFAAVKDSALMSALAGSLATALFTGLAAGPLSQVLGMSRLALLASVGLLCAAPVLGLVIDRRLRREAMRDGWRIAAVQLARVLANVVLVAWMWRLLCPEVSHAVWIMLAAGRLVVTRLPLIPQREVALAAFAVLLLPGAAVAGAATITGTLLTLGHLVVWTATRRPARATMPPPEPVPAR